MAGQGKLEVVGTTVCGPQEPSEAHLRIHQGMEICGDSHSRGEWYSNGLGEEVERTCFHGKLHTVME